MSNQTGVIVFASQKGGSGKTTLSGHVAVEAERAGDGPVALIDTDPQGSLAKWWNARESNAPAFAQVSIQDLEEGIAHLKRNGFRLIVIDTPPAVTESISYVVAHSDLVVVPTRPSPHDLRAVGPTVDIVESFGKSLVFVVNSATARARITGETAVALSQHGVVAPVTVHNRVEFAASMIDGRTVGEVRSDSKSAQEISTLWSYLRERVARIVASDAAAAADRADFTASVLSPARASDASDDDDFDEIEFPDELGLPINPAVTPRQAPAPAPLPSAAQTYRSPHAAAPQSPAASGNGKGALNGHAAPQAASGWDGVDRRKIDRGPPRGTPERRRAGFGRRGLN